MDLWGGGRGQGLRDPGSFGATGAHGPRGEARLCTLPRVQLGVGLPCGCWRWPDQAQPGQGQGRVYRWFLSAPNARRCSSSGVRAQLCTFPGAQGSLGTLLRGRDGVLPTANPPGTRSSLAVVLAQCVHVREAGQPGNGCRL